MTTLTVLLCRIVIAVAAEIIHTLQPDQDDVEPFGPVVKWGKDADYRMEP